MSHHTDHLTHDTLLASLANLQATLDAPPQVCRHDLSTALRSLESALLENLDASEDSPGEIDVSRHTLARRMDRNRLELVNLLLQVRGLREGMENHNEGMTQHGIRHRATRLLNAIRQSHATEDALVLESACLDIGAGD